MTIPYYPELEKHIRNINFGNAKTFESEYTKEELLSFEIKGSYLTKNGLLINCTTSHKGNNIKKIENSDFSLINNSYKERELGKEISLIKKTVPLSERSSYFI